MHYTRHSYTVVAVSEQRIHGPRDLKRRAKMPRRDSLRCFYLYAVFACAVFATHCVLDNSLVYNVLAKLGDLAAGVISILFIACSLIPAGKGFDAITRGTVIEVINSGIISGVLLEVGIFPVFVVGLSALFIIGAIVAFLACFVIAVIRKRWRQISGP